ncbi:MAG: extracellular solute-binding protein [Dehalococcoidia bacterium]
MKLRYVFPIFLLMVALAVTACGGDDPTPTPRPTPTTPAAAATATPLPAWQVEYNELIAAATAEGEVIVWAAAGQEERDFYKGEFEKAFPGIEVTLFQTARSSERDNRYTEERDAGVASLDIFMSGGGSPNRRLGGTAKEIEPFFVLPELAREFWEGNEYLWGTPDGVYFFQSSQTTGPAMIVNKDVDVSEITDWTDLLDPKWKGNIVMMDPTKSGGGYARGLFFYHVDGFGPDFTKRFYSETDITFNQDDRQIAEWVATGKMLIGINFNRIEAEELITQGLGIKFIKSLTMGDRRVEIVTSSPGIVFIPDVDLPHPNASKLYLNWFLSKEGQQLMMDTIQAQSRRTDVDPSVLPDSIQKEGFATYESMTPLATGPLTEAMRNDVVANLP